MSLLATIASTAIAIIFLLPGNENKTNNGGLDTIGKRDGDSGSNGGNPNIDTSDRMDLLANIMANGEKTIPTSISIPNIVKSGNIYEYNTQIDSKDIVNKIEKGISYKTISNGLFEWWVEGNTLTDDDLIDINSLFFKRGFYTGSIKRLKKVYVEEWHSGKPMGLYDDTTDLIHITLPNPTRRFNNTDYWKQAVINTLKHEYGHLITMHSIANDENDVDETVRYFNKLVQGNPENRLVAANMPNLVCYERNESLLRDFYMALSTGQRKMIKENFGINVDRNSLYYTTFPWQANDYEGSFEELVTRSLLALTSMPYESDMPRNSQDSKWGYEPEKDIYEWQSTFRSNIQGNTGPNFIDMSHLPNKTGFEGKWMEAYNMFSSRDRGTYTETGNAMLEFYKKLFNYNNVVNDLYVENNILNASLWLSQEDANQYDGALMFDGQDVQYSPLVKVSNTFNITTLNNWDEKRGNDWDNNITEWDKKAYHLEFNYTSSPKTIYLYKDKNSDGKIQTNEIKQIHGANFNKKKYRFSVFGSSYTLQANESSKTLKIEQ